MKKRCMAGLSAVILMALSIVTAGAQKNTQAEAMMAAAQQKETVEGDLNAAIKQYREIATKYAKTDRAAAAMALLRMADAYRKMGDAQSRKVYEQVVKDFSDQKDAVTLARARREESASGRPNLADRMGPRSLIGIPGRLLFRRPFLFLHGRRGDVFLHEIATGVDRNLTKPAKGRQRWRDRFRHIAG